jgi:hypothetical protein
LTRGAARPRPTCPSPDCAIVAIMTAGNSRCCGRSYHRRLPGCSREKSSIECNQKKVATPALIVNRSKIAFSSFLCDVRAKRLFRPVETSCQLSAVKCCIICKATSAHARLAIFPTISSASRTPRRALSRAFLGLPRSNHRSCRQITTPTKHDGNAFAGAPYRS